MAQAYAKFLLFGWQAFGVVTIVTIFAASAGWFAIWFTMLIILGLLSTPYIE